MKWKTLRGWDSSWPVSLSWRRELWVCHTVLSFVCRLHRSQEELADQTCGNRKSGRMNDDFRRSSAFAAWQRCDFMEGELVLATRSPSSTWEPALGDITTIITIITMASWLWTGTLVSDLIHILAQHNVRSRSSMNYRGRNRGMWEQGDFSCCSYST